MFKLHPASKSLGLGALASLGLFTAACSQPAAPEAAPPPQGYVVATMGEGSVADQDGVITFTRAGNGNQGVTLMPGPMLYTFTVEGEAPRVRARQDGQWIELPTAAEYSVMMGRGGAGAVQAFSRTGDTLVLRVVSVTDCSRVACAPVPQAAGTEATPPAAAPAE